MRSIQTKFIALIIVGIVLSASFIGLIALYRVDKNANNESTAMLNQLASTNAAEINGLMGRIEQSVEVIAGCASDFVDDIDRFSDESYREEYMNYLEPIMLNAAYSTDGSVAVYIRLNPDISSPVSGSFFIKTGSDIDFRPEPVTDLSLYEPSEIERVGWYYIPVEAGEPTWVGPYVNKNINVYMVSYVIPVYVDDTLLGIVGMDIDFSMLEKSVDSITLYETGYAYLADEDFVIVYHRDLEKGVSAADNNINFVSMYDKYSTDDYEGNLYEYVHNGVKRRMSFRQLNNGINLYVTAPQSEIDSVKNDLVLQIIVITVIVALAFAIVTLLICRSLIKPLKRLTAAAEEISTGNLDVDISVQTKDEIGTLASVFRNTVSKLKLYIDKINKLAYIDSLTGTQNKTAYTDAVKAIEARIEKGTARFAVAVLDINGLKQINDTKGHYYGDLLISGAAKLIYTAFIGCPIYRIGGDEFAVIMEDINYDSRKALFAKLGKLLDDERERGGEQCISIAGGMSEFDPKNDRCYDDVFMRADSAMYENKKTIKEEI